MDENRAKRRKSTQPQEQRKSACLNSFELNWINIFTANIFKANILR